MIGFAEAQYWHGHDYVTLVLAVLYILHAIRHWNEKRESK